MKTMIPRAAALMFLGTFAMTCGPALDPDKEAPNRCFEGVNLLQLIEAENLPQLSQSGYGGSQSNTAIENQLFDGTQVAELPLELPGSFGGRLCERLRDQLSRRCDVKELWIGADACAGVVESSSQAVTAADGTYKLRPVIGRVALVVARAQDGKSKVVLTTTEWKN